MCTALVEILTKGRKVYAVGLAAVCLFELARYPTANEHKAVWVRSNTNITVKESRE